MRIHPHPQAACHVDSLAVEDVRRSGVSEAEPAALREDNKRVRLQERENEVLRRTAAYRDDAHRTCPASDVHGDESESGYLLIARPV
ncbi:MAG: hypothetical protein F2911_09845 [Actinobacteria bacterium]|nr:hypothetical protein [Actinomycetota bacterium]